MAQNLPRSGRESALRLLDSFAGEGYVPCGICPECTGHLYERAALARPDVAQASPVQWVRRALAERISPELCREALQDPLTGALNRRADRAATARALTERRDGTRVVRLRADPDNFKALNDVHGHAAGDSALCVVRDALERATREVDLVSLARPGGDEFALTLRVAVDTDPEAIRDRIEQAVNGALAEAGLREAGGRQIGISVGVAEVNGPITPAALDAAADAATRERKRARGVSKPRSVVPSHRLCGGSRGTGFPKKGVYG